MTEPSLSHSPLSSAGKAFVCPVCGKRGTGLNGVEECPQCKSNLRVFSLASALGSTHEARRNQTDKEKTGDSSPFVAPASWRRIIGPLAFLMVILGMAGGMFYHWERINHRLTSFTRHNKELISNLKTDVQGMEKRVMEHIKNNESNIKTLLSRDKFLEYVVKKDDTLWDLAKKYWSSGHYFPLLLEYNPSLSQSRNNEGSSIRILKDVRAVKERYEELVVRVAGIAFFKYKIKSWDTWKNLAHKFMGRQEDARVLKRLNWDRLDVGQRILIPMGKVAKFKEAK